MRLVRLLGYAFVERGHDGGLLLFREALGRLLGEDARVAAEKLRLEAEDWNQNPPEDGVRADKVLVFISVSDSAPTLVWGSLRFSCYWRTARWLSAAGRRLCLDPLPDPASGKQPT